MGCYLVPHGILAAFAAKLTRKPLIQLLPGTDVQTALNNRTIFRFIEMADCVITRGATTNRQLSERGIPKSKLYHIPNLLNFAKVPLKPDNIESEYDLVYVGRFVKAKRIDLLLAVIRKLKSFFPDIRAALIGDGKLRARMEKLAMKFQLERNVVFPGFQTNVYTWLHRAKIFVMTSECEGQPMAMIEAMGSGLPCVIPDISNIPTLAIHEVNALLVPAGDIDGFVHQIVRLLTDTELYDRLSENARKIRQEKHCEYSLEGVTDIWNVIFQHLEEIKSNRTS
jgi:glycosyltransferase involved in cell wall biosynthesis